MAYPTTLVKRWGSFKDTLPTYHAWCQESGQWLSVCGMTLPRDQEPGPADEKKRCFHCQVATSSGAYRRRLARAQSEDAS